MSRHIDAQTLSPQQNDLELNRRESAFAEQLQQNLKQTLSEYYDNRSYIVNVRAHLERIPEKVQTARPQTVPPETQMNLPGLPVSPYAGQQEDSREYYNEQWLFSDRFKVKYMEISVLADNEVFTNDDVVFVNRVIKSHPDVDTIRGDSVNVMPLLFPVKDKGITEDIIEEAPEKASFFASVPYYVYVIAGILVLLLLVILILQIIGLRRSNKKPKEGHENSALLPALGSSGQQGLMEPIPRIQLPPAGGQNNGFLSAQNNKDIFYELRQLMVTTLIGNPELSGDILRKWTDSNKDEEIYKLAAFLKATDPKLTEFLAEHLGRELTAKVEFAMNQIQTIDKDSLTEVFKKFREEFQNEQSLRLMKGKNSGDEGDVFHFLRQLEPHQIFQLIKDEPMGITAVALAQVSPETANEVVNNLPVDEQLRIPVEIGKLKRIPISAYRDIAKKLSKKAIELDKIRFVTTDGINALIDMLEQSSPEMEEQLLASVAEHDIALAEELRKVYISFEQLTLMPDRLLADILRDMDRDTLVKALINSKEEVKDKILTNLPPRTKVIVSDRLETLQEDTPIEEITGARHLITQRLRDMAKSGKVDLTKYIQ
ncbi:MAG: FliG C-terminal domain-containing protein [Elusimicrobiota bacterium]